MAEKSIVNSLIGDDLARGDLLGHAKNNPFGTAATLGTLAGGVATISPIGLAATLAGRGIDSYNSSVDADNNLETMGVYATGVDGEQIETSAFRDFLPSFLGGVSAEDQERDIANEYFKDMTGPMEEILIPKVIPTDDSYDIPSDSIYTPGSIQVSDLPSPSSPTSTANQDFYNSGIQGSNSRSLMNGLMNNNGPDYPDYNTPMVNLDAQQQQASQAAQNAEAAQAAQNAQNAAMLDSTYGDGFSGNNSADPTSGWGYWDSDDADNQGLGM